MIPIVILGYNKHKLTQECLAAAREAGYPEKWLHVADNGSREGYAQTLSETFPRAGIWRRETNGGYAGGFNFALRRVFSLGFEEAFFLSNDTALERGAVEACQDTAARFGAGLVAPAVLQWKRSGLDSLGGWFDRKRLELKHYRDWADAGLLGEDDFVPGSALWISRAAFEQLGGVDEYYFSYWEDADLGFRACSAAIPMARSPEARVRHRMRATCGGKHLYTTYYYWRNRIRFCRRHLSTADWQTARARLAAELERQEERWRAAGDTVRPDYLPELRRELD